MVRGINGPRRGGAGGLGRNFDLRTIVNRVAPNPVATMLEMKDTLQLTAEQITRLQAIADSLNAKNDTLITVVEAQIAKGQGGGDLAAIFPAIQPRLQEARNNYLAAVKSAQGVLTREQWQKLPEQVRNPTLQRGLQRRLDGGARPPA
jgi:hypothetical protein